MTEADPAVVPDDDAERPVRSAETVAPEPCPVWWELSVRPFTNPRGPIRGERSVRPSAPAVESENRSVADEPLHPTGEVARGAVGLEAQRPLGPVEPLPEGALAIALERVVG